MDNVRLFGLLIVLASFGIGIFLYPTLPDKMASHWNEQGQVNGYMSKPIGVFLLPIITTVLFLFLMFIPSIDPLKSNIKKFRRYYDNFILVMILFMFYVYALTTFWNLEMTFGMVQSLSPAMGLLFYYAGVLIERSKRNYFIGIRTPWTLSSDKVWDRTSRLGGKLFKIAGLISVLGVFLAAYAMLLVILPIIFFSVYLVVYSYFEYKKIKRK